MNKTGFRFGDVVGLSFDSLISCLLCCVLPAFFREPFLRFRNGPSFYFWAVTSRSSCLSYQSSIKMEALSMPSIQVRGKIRRAHVVPEKAWVERSPIGSVSL